MKRTFKKYIFELRYSPHSRIIDSLGEIAATFTIGLFDQWKISGNEVKFTVKGDKNVEAVFGYNRLAFLVRSPHTEDFFLTNVTKFLKKGWTRFPPENLNRVGVRTTFISEKDNYESTFIKHRDGFIKSPDKNLLKMAGSLKDVGIALDFVDGDIMKNLLIGPLRKDELEKQLKSIESVDAKGGAFMDVDIYKTNWSGKVKQSSLIDFLKKSLKSAEVSKKVIDSILNDE